MYKRMNLINLLKTIEKNQENKLLIELRLIILNKIKAKQQLNMLITYKNEYVQQYNIELKESVSVFKLINYNNFIYFLSYGISQQKIFLKNLDNKYKIKLSLLEISKNRLKIWDSFTDQFKINMLHINDFKTQIQQDALCIFYKNLFNVNK